MQFFTIFVVLISAVSAIPITLSPADAYAASKGDEYSKKLLRLNNKYSAQASTVGVTSSAFKAMSSAILKCNIASAVQMAAKLSLEESNASKLRTIQNNYNIEVVKLKSKYKIASCSK